MQSNEEILLKAFGRKAYQWQHIAIGISNRSEEEVNLRYQKRKYQACATASMA